MSDQNRSTSAKTSSRESSRKQSSPLAESNSGVAVSHLSLFSVSTDALLAEIDAAENRLSSGLVDLENAASVAGIDVADASVGPFLDLLEAELDRVAGCIASQSESVESAARALLTSTDCTLPDSSAVAASSTRSLSRRRSSEMSGKNTENPTEYFAQEALKFRGKTSDLVSMSLSLNYFARKTAAEFRSIAREADNHIGTSCSQIAHRKLTSSMWSSFSLGGNIIALLSDVYCNIRAIEMGGSKKSAGEKWVAPANFERLTKKYWVKEEKLIEVMFASVAEVPLLVYGRSGRITPKDGELIKASQCGRDRLWDSLATPVNSVYFDNESMSLYSERIKRSEGAQLLRVRWYGEERPQGSEVLFLELKTHHEKWVNTKSVKQRVSICEKDMRAMFDKSKLGQEWTREHTENIVLRADPSIRGEKLNDAVNLLLECRHLVVKLRLRPCVRTKYLRVAFQSSESNSLRLTIDRDITMIDERGAPSDSWCLPDDSTINATSQVARAPCAVFEVKLSGSDDPPFIQDLERRSVIIDGHKFSKFLTGGAAFNRDMVPKLPYWATFGAFKPMFDKNKQLSSKAVLSNEKGGSIREVRMQRANLGVSLRESVAATRAEESGFEDELDAEAQTAYPAAPPPTVPASSTTPGIVAGTSKSSGIALQESQGMRRARDDAVEKSGAKNVSENSKFALFASTLGLRRRSSKSDKIFAQKKPTRVEPKSFFANERTFIQWISAALLMITVSIVLFEVGQEDARYMGIVLCIIGMAVAVYSLFLYFRRVYLMKNGKPYGYVDHLGPVVLTGAILFGVSGMLYYHARRTSVEAASLNANISSNPGQCDLFNIAGVSKLEYQPSDALIDTDRGILLVPSMNQITALYLEGNTGGDLRVVADIRGADFEAMTYAEGIVYVISESGSESELFAFEWDTSGEKLSEVTRWKLPLKSSEGLAYVLKEGGLGELYITSGDAEDIHIHVYDVPHLSEPMSTGALLSPVRELNSNLMTKNLEEPKIASMCYFEGFLYVLHDNARVIRSWDLKTGEHIAEYSLPAVSGGFSKQWEGMALLKTTAQQPSLSTTSGSNANLERDHNLRKTPLESTASLKLYLTLDTPPQVWAVEIGEASDGVWNFPDCAEMHRLK